MAIRAFLGIINYSKRDQVLITAPTQPEAVQFLAEGEDRAIKIISEQLLGQDDTEILAELTVITIRRKPGVPRTSTPDVLTLAFEKDNPPRGYSPQHFFAGYRIQEDGTPHGQYIICPKTQWERVPEEQEEQDERSDSANDREPAQG